MYWIDEFNSQQLYSNLAESQTAAQKASVTFLLYWIDEINSQQYYSPLAESQTAAPKQLFIRKD